MGFTILVSPNESRLPTLVADLRCVLSMAISGMVNFPVSFTSLVTASGRHCSMAVHCLRFSSGAAVIPSAIAVMVIDFTAPDYIAIRTI